MPDLLSFHFDTHEVRIHLDGTDAPWWEAQDVCAILGIKDVSDAVSRLKVNEKRTGETRNALIINEKGLYRLIMRSNKPDAERFQEWVFGEVLPTIRKTGSYHGSVSTQQPLPQVRNPANQMLIDTIVRLDEVEQRALCAEQTAHAAEQTAHAAELRAIRAETKSDMALDDSHHMTLEEFILINGLIRQFPYTKHGEYARWLGDFCIQHILKTPKAPVLGKSWDREKSYPLQALAAWLRYEERRPQQITMMRHTGEGGRHG